MTRNWIRLILSAAALAAALSAAVRPAAADSGTVILEIRDAQATVENDDTHGGLQQDFYVIAQFEGQPPQTTPTIEDRDFASWVPPFAPSIVSPDRNQRFFSFQLQLWDHDSNSNDDPFDMSPLSVNDASGAFPRVTYDICTGEMYIQGVPHATWTGRYDAVLVGSGDPGPANNYAYASLHIAMRTDPPNWLPDNIKMVAVMPFQGVYHPLKIVADRETSVALDIDNSYPYAITAPVHAEIGDGTSVDTDDKTVTLAPATTTRVVMFDGRTHPAFHPHKAIGAPAKLDAWATVAHADALSPNAPPVIRECASFDNTGAASTMPIAITRDPKTLFSRFDYNNVPSLPPTFLDFGKHMAMFNREEKLRRASWPLASLNSQIGTTEVTSLLLYDEPVISLLDLDATASTAGVDRIVYAVPAGWFTAHGNVIGFNYGGTNGLSLGPFSRAVLAEDGLDSVSTHELGHTYGLSQHKCSNGGIAEKVLALGCRDEYSFPPSDGRPFAAKGFDILGTIYPDGVSIDSTKFTGSSCPSTVPFAGDVCAVNLMDFSTPLSMHWLDDNSYNYVLSRLQAGPDPELINVAAHISAPNGLGDGTAPPVFVADLVRPSFHFMGASDLPDSALSGNGEAWSGAGAFKVRLYTTGGIRDYRVNPWFRPTGQGNEVSAGLTLHIPWDPSATAMELIGPANLNDTACQEAYCRTGDVVLFHRDRSAAAPAVSNLRAGRDAPAPPGAFTPPVVGPGHDAVLTWSVADPDSSASNIRSIIIVCRIDPTGGPSRCAPASTLVNGGAFTIPHGQLGDDPGDYTAKVVVSDGMNGGEVDSGSTLFRICNFTNQGVEICNGIDDDCDGILDNAVAPPGSIAVGVDRAGLSWPAIAGGESYDVVRGDLMALRAAGGFASSTLGCLANDITATSAANGPDPAPGGGVWILVRTTNCGGVGTYDGSDASQAGSRDPGMAASPASCP